MVCSVKLSNKFMLFMFTCINLLILIDRGALAAVVPLLEKESGLGLTSVQAGSLGSVFMFGYILASPLFAYYSSTFHPIYLMAVGNFVWTAAVFFTGLSYDYFMILAARSITGIGEASFVCLAPPCILDIAPKGKQNLWIGIFYSSSALGYAFGFIFGNQVSLLTGSWKYPFFIEGLLMVPFIVVCLVCYKDPGLYAKREDGKKENLYQEVCSLLKIPVFVFLCLGYSCYQFTIGGIAFWGPYFIEKFYKVNGQVATIALGSVTVFCGLVGTFAGSALLDYLIRKYQEKNEQSEELDWVKVEKSNMIMPYALFLGMCFSIVFLSVSVLVDYPGNLLCYLSGLTIGEFFIFLVNTPIAISTMFCVPNHLRGQSNAISIFILHVFGDFPSPTIIGAWFDTIGMFLGMICTLLWLCFGSILWFIAWDLSVIPT
jgi:MFS family permease